MLLRAVLMRGAAILPRYDAFAQDAP